VIEKLIADAFEAVGKDGFITVRTVASRPQKCERISFVIIRDRC
jgi:hypothetical protein